jgi:hypothetical protein
MLHRVLAAILGATAAPGKSTNVLFLRDRRRTNRETTNAAPDDANKEPAAERVVAREPVPRYACKSQFLFFILEFLILIPPKS